MRRLLALILFILLVTVASASQRWVAKTGSNSNSGADSAHAWLTFSYAALHVVPGDTVKITAGTYVEGQVMLNIAGTYAHPIVFMSTAGWATIINGAVQFNVRHNTVRDVAGIFDIHVDNQMFKFTGDPDSSAVIHCTMYQGSARDTCCGILANSEGDDAHRIQHVVIDSNVIHGFGGGGHGHGIYACGNHTVITHNTVYSNNVNGIQNYPSGDSDTVAYNVCYGNGGSGIVTTGEQNSVHDNICYNNASAGIHINASGIPNLTYSNTVFNNTLYNNQWGVYTSSADSNRVYNNISLANTVNQMVMAYGIVPGFNYNCYYPDGGFDYGAGQKTFAQYRAATGQDANGLCTNPMVVDTAAHNFALAPGSPCIGTGFGGVDMGARLGSIETDSLDAGVVSISAPPGVIDSGSMVTPSATVHNYGTKTVSFTVKLTVSAYKDSQSVSNLTAGSSTVVNFANWTATPLGIFAVKCSTRLTNDQDHSNDALSGSVTVNSATLPGNVIRMPFISKIGTKSVIVGKVR